MPTTYREKEFINQKKFINQLTEQLSQGRDWKVDKEDGDSSVDLVVLDPNSGKRIFIEFQEAGEYGSLPISSVLSLYKQKKRLSAMDSLFLITFSGIPTLLASKLKELGIMAFAKPSVEEVVGKVQYAMSA
jgi:hypothetical protein